jgi:hypothetical protein
VARRFLLRLDLFWSSPLVAIIFCAWFLCPGVPVPFFPLECTCARFSRSRTWLLFGIRCLCYRFRFHFTSREHWRDPIFGLQSTSGVSHHRSGFHVCSPVLASTLRVAGSSVLFDLLSRSGHNTKVFALLLTLSLARILRSPLFFPALSASVLLKLPALVLLKFQFFFRFLVCDLLQGDAGIALESPDQKTRGFVV